MSTRLRYILEKIAVDIDKLREVNQKKMPGGIEGPGFAGQSLKNIQEAGENIANRLIKDGYLAAADKEKFLHNYTTEVSNALTDVSKNHNFGIAIKRNSYTTNALAMTSGEDVARNFVARVNINPSYRKKLHSLGKPLVIATNHNNALKELYLSHELSEDAGAAKQIVRGMPGTSFADTPSDMNTRGEFWNLRSQRSSHVGQQVVEDLTKSRTLTRKGTSSFTPKEVSDARDSMMQLREPEIQEMSRVLNKQPALKKRLLQEYYLGYSPDTVSGRGFDKMPALTAEIERRKKMNESFNLKINAAAKRGDTATVDRLKAQLKSENPLDILHELNPRMNSKHREHLYSVLDRESMVPQELAELNEYNENTKKWKEMQREERIAQHQLGESRKAAKKAINNGSTNNTTTGTPKEVAKDVINTDSKLKGTLLNRDPNAPLKTNVTGEPVLKGKMAPKATETAKEVAKDVISGAHATATPSTTHTPIIASGGGGGGHSPSTTHTPSTTATPNTTHTPIIASGGGGGGSGSYHAPTSKKVAPNKFRYGKHLLAAGLVGGAGYGLHRYMNRDK